jgi:putative methionine-R-sulfoxide reductase with GAF domain
MEETFEQSRRRAGDLEAMKLRPARARYNKVQADLDLKWRRREISPERRMREIVDELWLNFEKSPYSWCGFYVLAKEGSALNLGPHRDSPRASPLGLESLCGKALTGASTLVAPSEIAVPVRDDAGKAWAVFNAVSEKSPAFDEMDKRWLERILDRFRQVDE